MELVVDCGVKVNNAVLNAKPLNAPLQEGPPHIDIETFVHVRVFFSLTWEKATSTRQYTDRGLIIY